MRRHPRQRLTTLPAAFHLGAYGLEVHEPRFEHGARHCFQCFVLLAVQFDLVVQRAEDMGDSLLLCDRRNQNRFIVYKVAIE